MSIEIKQFQIKTHIVSDHQPDINTQSLNSFKRDILAQCRRMVTEIIEKQQDR